MFLPIPAIDLMSGQVVRLSRGRADAKTVYSDDPVGVAREFERQGARRLHVVDLDGAFGGEMANLPVIRAIREAVGMEIEVGGGLRTCQAVRTLLEAGVNYAILGTSALRDRPLVEVLAGEYGSRLIVGVDAKDGMVAVEGWVETSDLKAVEFARELTGLGVGTIIYTDIATDGMMTGPNLDAQREMAQAIGANVIASGGIRDVRDLLDLQALGEANLIGAITGRAVYEKKLDIAEAVSRLGAGS